MNQTQRVLNALKSQEWVTTVDAVSGRLGEPILRLGALIFTLKKAGHNIESEIVEGKNYAKYKLVVEPEQLKII